MTDLESAHRAIELLERQLQEQAIATHHARWTDGGELVLIGDVGRFRRGDELIEAQVVALDARSAEMRATVGRTVRKFRFAEAAELVGRAQLPKAG